jgi:hypothetical protein
LLEAFRVQPLAGKLKLNLALPESIFSEKISHAKAQRRKGAKAQRRKENPLETRQRFAPLRLCGRNLLDKAA